MMRYSFALLAALLCAGALRAQASDTVVYVMDTAVYNQLDGRGRKQGLWQKRYPNGRTAYRAYFVDDRPLGLLVRYHENGRRMAVVDYFDDGTAFAQLFSPQGALIAEGSYVGESARHGVWRYYRAGQPVMDEEYERGLLHGTSQLYFPDGGVYERKRFVRGVQQGMQEQLDARGQPMFELMYAAGLQHGAARYYYDSGQLRIEGQYREGVRVGEWTFYDARGMVERRTTYTGGVADDRDEVDRRNSEELKRLEAQRGRMVEPEEMLRER